MHTQCTAVYNAGYVNASLSTLPTPALRVPPSSWRCYSGTMLRRSDPSVCLRNLPVHNSHRLAIFAVHRLGADHDAVPPSQLMSPSNLSDVGCAAQLNRQVWNPEMDDMRRARVIERPELKLAGGNGRRCGVHSAWLQALQTAAVPSCSSADGVVASHNAVNVAAAVLQRSEASGDSARAAGVCRAVVLSLGAG